MWLIVILCATALCLNAAQPIFPESDEDGIVEGDMILDDEQIAALHGLALRNAMGLKRYLWPNATLPYEIDDQHFNKKQVNSVRKAFNFIASVSCLNIRPRETRDKHYVRVVGGKGCHTMVGFRRRGMQPLTLGRGCMGFGTMLHEMMHTLGFLHMHNVPGRDKYVSIVWDNIRPGSEKNFIIYKVSINSLGMDYDYGSVMHYGMYAFSKNRQKTIVPKDPNAKINPSRLSEIDIKKINLLYSCPVK